jgi:MFS family permease
MDGVVVAMVLQNIKTDLHLSDGQLGFLTGIAFFTFYAIMGIPIARWADRGNRVVIIAGSTALWGATMALCGMVGSFAQLLVVRVCAAVGEAGCTPPSLSLISDHFSRAERPRAIATYALGWSLALLIGYFAAGWLNQFFGWRMTFILMGAPSLALAVLTWLTLKDPRELGQKRQRSPLLRAVLDRQSERKDPMAPNFVAVVRGLSGIATFRHLLIFQVMQGFFGAGIAQFQPAFLIRSYGLSSGELGTLFAVTYGITGVVGTYWGGEWASRYAANNERLQLRAITTAYSVVAVCLATVYLTKSCYLTVGLLGLFGLAASVLSGPIFAILQTLVPPEQRATSIALISLLVSLVGSGLGPLTAGVLSDVLRPWFGEESLRYALLALTPGYLLGGWHLWKASNTVTRDLAATQDSSCTIPLRALEERVLKTPIA